MNVATDGMEPPPAPLPAGGIRRRTVLAAGLAALVLGACRRAPLVIGRAGVERGGTFLHPRAVAAGPAGLAVIDKTGRLQIFDLEGAFVESIGVAPEGSRRGLPVGVTWLPDGNLAVADTHQSRVRVYDRSGATVRAFGEYGVAPGAFLMPQRIACTPGGGLVVTDHGLGATNRVQVFGPDDRCAGMFGGPLPEAGGLARPMGVLADTAGYLVADQRAGLVRFGPDGTLVGPPAGWRADLDAMPYGLTRDDGGTLFVSDLRGQRILRLDPDGTPTGALGGMGRDAGLFMDPWDVQWHAGYLFVADAGNHRVQRIDARRAGWERV